MAKRYSIDALEVQDSFTRASAAYLNGKEYAINDPRSVPTVVVSETDGSYDGVGKGESDRAVVVWTSLKGVLYGIDSNQTVYTSSDGADTWAVLDDAPKISSLFSTPDGNLIGVQCDSTKNHQDKVQRYDSASKIWSEITLPDTFSCNAQQFGWSFKIGGKNGQTILMTEYSSDAHVAGTGPSTRRIFRSTDDGLSWTKCFDGQTFWAEEIASDAQHVPSHIHSIHYHAGTGRWFSFWGDSARRRILYSTDDGLTWKDFYPPGDLGVQPISFMDFGHPTKLLCGSDDTKPLYTIDCLSGNVETVWENMYHVPAATFCFAIGKYAGVYYAVLSESVETTDKQAILVSLDALNWHVYHQFSGTELNANRGPFYAAGKLHWPISGAGHFRMSPAKIQPVTGTMISPATKNEMAANTSICESGWTSGSGVNVTLSYEATGGYYGDTCIKATGPANNPYWRDTTLNLTRGTKYIYSAMIKGRQTEVRLRTGDNNTLHLGLPVVTYRADDEWSPALSYVYEVPDGEGATDAVRLWMAATQRSVYGTIENFVTYTDMAQCIPLPIKPWALGQASVSPDVLTQTVTVGKVWTDVFAVETIAPMEYYDAPAALVVKSWAVDPDNKIDILYDPSDNKFKLQRTIGGSAEAAKETAAQYWHGNACVKFILRVSATDCILVVQNAKAAETLTDDGGMAALLDGEIVGTYGDFPMVILDGWKSSDVYPFWLSDADAESVMANITHKSMQPATGGAGAELLGGGSLLGN
mgnify:CR=1 FL=1|jgi:hypothetical protein